MKSNEDETFRLLRRISFEKMRAILKAEFAEINPGADYEGRKTVLLKTHGWTRSEYIKHLGDKLKGADLPF